MVRGFSTEDHIFKVHALGAPFFKAICMGRALTISGMVGKNIFARLKQGKLLKTVSQFGEKPEHIFLDYGLLKYKHVKDLIDELHFGAIGIYTFTEKLKLGLQELLTGTMSFRVDKIARKDLMALTEDAEQIFDEE